MLQEILSDNTIAMLSSNLFHAG